MHPFRMFKQERDTYYLSLGRHIESTTYLTLQLAKNFLLQVAASSLENLF